jgi:putative solute:sodium symporter small subunit
MTHQTTHSPPRAVPVRSAKEYWSANLRIIGICLAIWALVSFGFAIILRPLLSGIAVGGTDLGFWFAQQGSMIIFVALIFFYAWRMNRLDREFGVDEEV